MGIREYLNRHPGIAAGLIGLVIVAAGYLALASNRDYASQKASRAYYSDDDGKTFFADDAEQIFPFERNGKQAYRATVFQVGDEPPFVTYLSRYTDAAKAQLTALRAKPADPTTQSEIAELVTKGIEVKKVGDTTWMPSLDARAAEFTGPPPAKTPGQPVRGVVP